MMQAILLDEHGFYVRPVVVEKLEKNMTDIIPNIGYIKAQFKNGLWQEGATDDEIKEWKESQQIDISPTKTNKELQEELLMLKEELAQVTERLTMQQEMSSITMEYIYGNEVAKND